MVSVSKEHTLAKRVHTRIAGSRRGGVTRGAGPHSNRYLTTYSVYYSAVYRKTALRGPRGPTRKILMVRLKVYELMAARSISAYKLSQETDLTYPSAYRLSRAGGRFGRLHAETLEQLCQFFQVQPGKLLQWEPAKSD